MQSMEFSRPEYWSGEPLPSPQDIPNPGIKPVSPALQADSLPSEPAGKPPKVKCFNVNLTKYLSDLQEENDKTIVKK